ncbi:hypothetical protein GCM10008107_20470 [Psychrosphaera saromensis]|nr:hypothetical protein GCM10008107_20470 [Psychrosphaera saromensis]
MLWAAEILVNKDDDSVLPVVINAPSSADTFHVSTAGLVSSANAVNDNKDDVSAVHNN